MTNSSRLLLSAIIGLSFATAACEEEVVQSTYVEKPAAAADAVAGDDAGVVQADAGPPKVEFQESDFTETERSRDPFRNYAEAFLEESRSNVRSQREVLLDQYSVDELKLIGLVTRIAPARAMLLDPTGKGHVVTRGQFVGRAERVQAGTSGAEYEINWRLDRIRDEDIVLIREDPSHPDVPSATRVIPLRSEGTLATN